MLATILLALMALGYQDPEWVPPVWTKTDAALMFDRWCQTDARFILDCPSPEGPQ